ncbi:MAG: SIMPL domain-containing protein [Patescibacteria group bacterium]|nr:SIMPL domain-containing protein [Patescibacteria group bacterium]MDD5173177.1 SIMPL domain-containing protein [Patescibacteria group bacterium]
MECKIMEKNFLRPIIIILVIYLVLTGILKYASGLTWSLRSVTIPKEEPFQVSAQGEVYLKPDTAEITLGVFKEGKTVTEVQKAVNEANNKIIEELKKLNVKEEKIKTVQYSINPRYEWDRNTSRNRLTGYQAEISLIVRTNDFEKLNEIIDQATLAGANQINSLSFVLEDEDKAKAQARDIAIEKAQEKAKEIAAVSGLNLGKLINVSISDTDYYPITRSYSLDIAKEEAMMGGGAQIATGETKITVNAVLSYEIK